MGMEETTERLRDCKFAQLTVRCALWELPACVCEWQCLAMPMRCTCAWQPPLLLLFLLLTVDVALASLAQFKAHTCGIVQQMSAQLVCELETKISVPDPAAVLASSQRTQKVARIHVQRVVLLRQSSSP
jgi:hypothetical protein